MVKYVLREENVRKQYILYVFQRMLMLEVSWCISSTREKQVHALLQWEPSRYLLLLSNFLLYN